MEKQNFISISAFEKASSLKLNSKITATSLSELAGDKYSIPATFKYDELWLKDIASKNKEIFSEKKEAKPKTYTTFKYDVAEMVLLVVSEDGKFLHDKVADHIGLCENQEEISTTIVPKDLDVLSKFVKESIYAESIDSFMPKLKRGEVAILIPSKELYELSLSLLICFQGE